MAGQSARRIRLNLGLSTNSMVVIYTLYHKSQINFRFSFYLFLRERGRLSHWNVNGDKRCEIGAIPNEVGAFNHSLFSIKSFLFSIFSRTSICCIAIWFSLSRRSDCGSPSLIKTAFRFSMFDRQISWFIEA